MDVGSAADITTTLVQRIPEGVSVTVAIVFTILYLKDRRQIMRDMRESLSEQRSAFLESLEKLEDRQDKRAEQTNAALNKVADKLDGLRRAG